MNSQQKKCVILLAQQLPSGLLANTAAIIGMTLGKQMPDAIGPDIADKTGQNHAGIVTFPIPVLQGTAQLLSTIRRRLYEPEFAGITVIDFSDIAQRCKTYAEYRETMSRTAAADLHYLGLGLSGTKKQIDALTGSLPLLR